MPIITKPNGLIGYENQSSQLQDKYGGEYSAVYPRQIGEGVEYNSNTLTKQGRHIELEANTINEALENLESRISQGGRTFDSIDFTPDGLGIVSVAYYNGAYYALFNNANKSVLYSSVSLNSWSEIYETQDYILFDMASFNGSLYLAGASKGSVPGYAVLKMDKTLSINVVFSELNSKTYTSGNIKCDDSTICIVLHASEELVSTVVYGIFGSDSMTTRTVSNITNLGDVTNIGHGLYLALLNDYVYIISNVIISKTSVKLTSLSEYDFKNGCLYGIGFSTLWRIDGVDVNSGNITINAVDSARVTSNEKYDMIYVNGKYIYTIHNTSTGKSACAYGVKPYSNELYTDYKYIMDIPLSNFTYQGEYIFGIRTDIPKLYYSLVK